MSGDNQNMPVSAELLRAHFDYTVWASSLVLDVARQLAPDELNRDFETADKSVLGTLVHIFAADRIWLERISGTFRTKLVDPEDRNFESLQQRWPVLHRNWQAWLAGLTDQDAIQNISFHDMSGNPNQLPVWQIVLHVVNHGTHHRGAISGFLRAMGHNPPKLDLAFYYRAIAARGSAA